MTGSDALAGSPYNEAAPGFQWSDDMLQMPTQGSTQWDALRTRDVAGLDVQRLVGEAT